MEKFSYYQSIKETKVSYFGNVAQSAKMKASKRNGTMTYCLYLAPSTMSGKNVCPNSEHCKEFCLNGSGRNKGDIISHGYEDSIINRSRIKKTKLFFEDREKFMRILIHEINVKKAYAEKLGYEFSVRLNGTSDLSPLIFKHKNVCGGKNILEIFPDVTFYDYTKVPHRFKVLNDYSNYDLTFSYDGYNEASCKEFLGLGGRVAVVFYGDRLPKKFNGYKVVDGNKYDMRYNDEKGVVVGLHYHKTANDYKVIDGKRRFVVPDTPFVVMPDDRRCEW